MTKKYDTFLFDLDGTVIDSSPGILCAFDYALAKFGIKETDRAGMYRIMGPPLAFSFTEYYGFSEEQARRAVEYYREYYSCKGIFESSVYEGLSEVFRRLRAAGCRLAIATLKPEKYAVKIAEHFGIAQYFDGVAGRAPDDMSAQKEDLILRALGMCGSPDKSGALMVGDRCYDVAGAHSAGVDCLGVLYGFGSKEELVSAGADYIAGSTEDILKFCR